MNDKNTVMLDRFKCCVDKYTREKIALGIGCDTSTVTKHYTGDRTITLDFAVKYARFFGVSLDYLVGITNVPTPETSLRAVCDYTGLNETSVEYLADQKVPFIMKTVPEILNFIFESDTKYDTRFFITLVSYISCYPKRNTIYDVTGRGELLTVEETLEAFDDVTAGTITASEIIETLLLEDLKDQLKALRKEYIKDGGESGTH